MAPNRHRSKPARFKRPKPHSLEARNPELVTYLKGLDARLTGVEGAKVIKDILI